MQGFHNRTWTRWCRYGRAREVYTTKILRSPQKMLAFKTGCTRLEAKGNFRVIHFTTTQTAGVMQHQISATIFLGSVYSLWLRKRRVLLYNTLRTIARTNAVLMARSPTTVSRSV